MKKILLFLVVLFVSFFAKAQFEPIQGLGSGSGLVQVAPNGALRGSLINRVFTDTTAANLTPIDLYPGAQIFTSSDNLFWFRNADATRWLQAGNNVTNVTNIIEAITDCYRLLIPGVVSWNSLLIFDISPAQYAINCNLYSSAQTQLTLTPAHATLNRIDVIYADTNGVVNYITGTPAADPAKPQVDPASQLELTSILVLAGATTPSGIAQNVIYDQNTGSPEWPGTATGVTVDFGSTAAPFHLTISADVGAFTAGQSFRWVKSSGTESINDYGHLKFYIRLKSNFSTQAMLRLDWMNGTTSVSSTVNLSNGQFGFSRTVTGSYQVITIPLSAWAFTSDNVNTLRVTMAGSNASGFYIDWVQLQSGITQNPIVFPNGFGVMQTPSGAAVSTQPNDIATYVGAGNIGITATGKTVTWTGTSSSSTVSIVNDSTLNICSPQGVCSSFVVSNVPIQQVFIVDYNTLLVCNTDGTVCDTFDIPIPQFFDRGFFDPDQASFTSTFHTMNGNDLRLIGGTLDINDDGLAITTRSIITPLQAVNDHTDLNNVKIGMIAARRVAGNGATGLGIGFRSDIDNDASTQTIAANMTTEWSAATAGSETATTKLWTVSGGTLASRFQIEGSTRIIANGVRLQDAKGSDVTAANDLTLGNGGNLFTITGNTTINAITTTNWQAGSNISFIFTGTPLVKNNTAGGAGTATMLLAGRVDFQAAAGDYIAFEYDGTNWYETNRKLAASTGTNTFSNYLTESGGAVKLGGTGVDAITTLTADEKQILMTFNSVAAGTGLNITSTSTAAASSTQKLVAINATGVNANSSQSTFALHVTNTHSGTSSTNYGGYFIANSGATSNRAVYGEVTSGIAVEGLSTGSTSVGVSGTSTGASGTGVLGTANNNSTSIAVSGTSTNGLAASFNKNPSSTNVIAEIARFQRTSTGTAANGIGGSINFYTETDGGSTSNSALIASTWTDAATATATGDLQFWTTNSTTSALGLTLHGNKRLVLAGRLATVQGADVASVAGAIAVGFDGNIFELTGTNAVTLISNLGWVNGNEITFVFTSTATLTDGTANSGTDIGMELAGNANFVGSADDVITLVLTELGGVQRWREKSRTVN